jgi:hypothetical protein
MWIEPLVRGHLFFIRPLFLCLNGSLLIQVWLYKHFSFIIYIFTTTKINNWKCYRFLIDIFIMEYRFFFYVTVLMTEKKEKFIKAGILECNKSVFIGFDWLSKIPWIVIQIYNQFSNDKADNSIIGVIPLKNSQ